MSSSEVDRTNQNGSSRHVLQSGGTARCKEILHQLHHRHFVMPYACDFLFRLPPGSSWVIDREFVRDWLSAPLKGASPRCSNEDTWVYNILCLLDLEGGADGVRSSFHTFTWHHEARVRAYRVRSLRKLRIRIAWFMKPSSRGQQFLQDIPRILRGGL